MSAAIISSLFFSLTLTFFSPLLIFLTNPKEFPFTISSVLPYLLLPSLFLIIFTTIIQLVLKTFRNKKILETTTSLLFIVGLLFWLQGNVIVWNYGLFDGKPILWEQFAYRNWIDGGVWLLLIIFTIYRPDIIHKLITKIGLLLIFTQATYITLLGLRQPELPSFKQYSISESTKFTFSKDKNVIILLIDTLQSNLFYEVLNEKKAYNDIFDGFSYFPDTVSSFPYTFLSIPSILTGQNYKNDQPTQNFIKNSYSQESLLKTLVNNGFRTEIYTEDPITLYFDTSLINNITRKETRFFDLKIKNHVLYLSDVTLFRILPAQFKKYLYNDQNWRLSLQNNNISPPVNNSSNIGQWGQKSINFVDNLTQKTTSDQEGSVFKFYHLRGTHLPYELTENLQIKVQPPDTESYKEQIRAMFTLTKAFLDKLKAIGVYDNSLIIVMADHGAGIPSDSSSELLLDNSFTKNNLSNNIDKKIISSGLPLLLIKPENSREDMHIIKTPASLTDLPKTISDYLGIPNNFPGINLLATDTAPTLRKRVFYDYDIEDENIWKNDYISFLNEYSINGFSWKGSSWLSTGTRFLPYGKTVDLSIKYNLGERIYFGKDTNSNNFMLGGWDNPEIDFNWTNESVATLRFVLAKPADKDLLLKTHFLPHVYINDTKVGEWSADEPKEHQITIPQNLISQGDFYINFVLSQSIESPKDLGINEDVRKLGIKVNYVELD